MNEKSWKAIIKSWGGTVPRPYIPIGAHDWDMIDIFIEAGLINRLEAVIGGTGPHHKGWGGPRPYIPVAIETRGALKAAVGGNHGYWPPSERQT